MSEQRYQSNNQVPNTSFSNSNQAPQYYQQQPQFQEDQRSFKPTYYDQAPRQPQGFESTRGRGRSNNRRNNYSDQQNHSNKTREFTSGKRGRGGNKGSRGRYSNSYQSDPQYTQKPDKGFSQIEYPVKDIHYRHFQQPQQYVPPQINSGPAQTQFGQNQVQHSQQPIQTQQFVPAGQQSQQPIQTQQFVPAGQQSQQPIQTQQFVPAGQNTVQNQVPTQFVQQPPVNQYVAVGQHQVIKPQFTNQPQLQQAVPGQEQQNLDWATEAEIQQNDLLTNQQQTEVQEQRQPRGNRSNNANQKNKNQSDTQTKYPGSLPGERKVLTPNTSEAREYGTSIVRAVGYVRQPTTPSIVDVTSTRGRTVKMLNKEGRETLFNRVVESKLAVLIGKFYEDMPVKDQAAAFHNDISRLCNEGFTPEASTFLSFWDGHGNLHEKLCDTVRRSLKGLPAESTLRTGSEPARIKKQLEIIFDSMFNNGPEEQERVTDWLAMAISMVSPGFSGAGFAPYSSVSQLLAEGKLSLNLSRVNPMVKRQANDVISKLVAKYYKLKKYGHSLITPFLWGNLSSLSKGLLLCLMLTASTLDPYYLIKAMDKLFAIEYTPTNTNLGFDAEQQLSQQFRLFDFKFGRMPTHKDKIPNSGPYTVFCSLKSAFYSQKQFNILEMGYAEEGMKNMKDLPEGAYLLFELDSYDGSCLTFPADSDMQTRAMYVSKKSIDGELVTLLDIGPYCRLCDFNDSCTVNSSRPGYGTFRFIDGERVIDRGMPFSPTSNCYTDSLFLGCWKETQFLSIGFAHSFVTNGRLLFDKKFQSYLLPEKRYLTPRVHNYRDYETTVRMVYLRDKTIGVVSDPFYQSGCYGTFTSKTEMNWWKSYHRIDKVKQTFPGNTLLCTAEGTRLADDADQHTRVTPNSRPTSPTNLRDLETNTDEMTAALTKHAARMFIKSVAPNKANPNIAPTLVKGEGFKVRAQKMNVEVPDFTKPHIENPVFMKGSDERTSRDPPKQPKKNRQRRKTNTGEELEQEMQTEQTAENGVQGEVVENAPAVQHPTTSQGQPMQQGSALNYAAAVNNQTAQRQVQQPKVQAVIVAEPRVAGPGLRIRATYKTKVPFWICSVEDDDDEFDYVGAPFDRGTVTMINGRRVYKMLDPFDKDEYYKIDPAVHVVNLSLAVEILGGVDQLHPCSDYAFSGVEELNYDIATTKKVAEIFINIESFNYGPVGCSLNNNDETLLTLYKLAKHSDSYAHTLLGPYADLIKGSRSPSAKDMEAFANMAVPGTFIGCLLKDMDFGSGGADAPFKSTAVPILFGKPKNINLFDRNGEADVFTPVNSRVLKTKK